MSRTMHEMVIEENIPRGGWRDRWTKDVEESVRRRREEENSGIEPQRRYCGKTEECGKASVESKPSRMLVANTDNNDTCNGDTDYSKVE